MTENGGERGRTNRDEGSKEGEEEVEDLDEGIVSGGQKGREGGKRTQFEPVARAPVLARASFLGVSPTSVQIPGAHL